MLITIIIEERTNGLGVINYYYYRADISLVDL